MNQSFNKMCKVCVDAGKPVNICNSHCVKNKDGTTDCPTLLEQECRYCSRKGHTVKYCPTLTKHQKEDRKVINLKNYTDKITNDNTNTNAKTKTKKINTNKFQALCDETSDEEEYAIVKKQKQKQTNSNKNNTKMNELFPTL
jgi:hypothetical protein